MHAFTPVPFYCEENTWKLLDSEAAADRDFHAIIISNYTGCAAIFNQKSETGEDVVFWDYHVVALERDGCNTRIWDYNTELGSPCDAREWLSASFRDNRMPDEYRPYFRMVPRGEYLAGFVSDRAHMRNPDGSFIKTPPPWDCIGTGESTLRRLINMKTRTPGRIYDYMGLRRFLEAPQDAR